MFKVSPALALPSPTTPSVFPGVPTTPVKCVLTCSHLLLGWKLSARSYLVVSTDVSSVSRKVFNKYLLHEQMLFLNKHMYTEK